MKAWVKMSALIGMRSRATLKAVTEFEFSAPYDLSESAWTSKALSRTTSDFSGGAGATAWAGRRSGRREKPVSAAEISNQREGVFIGGILVLGTAGTAGGA